MGLWSTKIMMASGLSDDSVPLHTQSRKLKFLIFTPVPIGSTKGNRITANRWCNIIRELGHHVVVTDKFDARQKSHRADCLIALHAVKSASAVSSFRKTLRHRPILLCLTGTDIHLDLQGDRGAKPKATAIKSMQTADRLILLEPECKKLLDRPLRKKTHLIVQSALPVRSRPSPLKRSFEVSVLSHLRNEKDPFRTAIAARGLPDSSRIQIKHLGGAYTKQLESKARQESNTNDRYRWLGNRPHGEARRLLARSRLTVLSSRLEGGPSVISEAIINDVPILATKISATVGLLGKDYPGFFEVGETDSLTQLLSRAETENGFYQQLRSSANKLKKRFLRSTEKNSWQTLIEQAIVEKPT